MEGVLKTVIRKIKPSEKEAADIGNFCTSLEKLIKDDFGYDAVVVGSLGKKTWISGDHDIDLFAFFEKGVSKDQLKKDGLEIGKRLADKLKSNFVVKYAEHPYTQISYKHGKNVFKIDVVPCYRIVKGERIVSAVDRSPLHLRFVLDHLKPEFRDDVRMLKRFMKGVDVYGSDVKNQGFSGYIAELLIIEYGKFENAIKNIASWNPPVRLDLSNKSQRKFNAPITIIDPVDIDRNAAAAISPENLQRLIFYAGLFLKKPSVKFFYNKPEKLTSPDITKIKKRGTKFIAMVMQRPDEIDDIIWPQLKRALYRLGGALGHQEFVVKRAYEFADDKNTLLIFELSVWKLPAIKRMIGPVIYAKHHVNEFLSKYNNALFGPFVDGEVWVAEKDREFQNVRDLLEAFAKSKPAKLIESGIPDHLAKVMGKVRILEDDSFWSFVRKNKLLSEYLKKKYSEKLC
ncbi:MAG: CCA tRNA nucleotidyltransferase [Candidatus Aenigmatarchaeota archaeon]